MLMMPQVIALFYTSRGDWESRGAEKQGSRGAEEQRRMAKGAEEAGEAGGE